MADVIFARTPADEVDDSLKFVCRVFFGCRANTKEITGGAEGLMEWALALGGSALFAEGGRSNSR